MLSVALEVRTECRKCLASMPVNTLALDVSCASCGSSTSVGADTWKALFRAPLYDGPKMVPNEGRRGATSGLSLSYTRLSPRCHECGLEIPVASILGVQDQAMLGCKRCGAQTWVRSVPSGFNDALPPITHIVGEDPDPLAGAPAPAAPATFPCPQCGSPLPFDGVTRAVTCRFCSASAHVPDTFVYRGRRRTVARWFICFHAAIPDAAPPPGAVAAGLFDWEEPPDAGVDEDGNLYCAATQVHWVIEGEDVKRKTVVALWSVDPSLKVRWVQQEQMIETRIAVSPQGRLLQVTPTLPLWRSSEDGRPLEQDARIQAALKDRLSSPGATYDRDGTLLVLSRGKLIRISPDGREKPLWGRDIKGKSDASMSPCELPSFPSRVNTDGDIHIYCAPDGSVYLMDSSEVARFTPGGQKVYGVRLPSEVVHGSYRVLGADLAGDAYVVCTDKLVRLSPTGKRSIVLESSRDGLPRSPMSIAVARDGSFWLFARNGLAWRFGSDGALLFASEREPRPRKPTPEELGRRASEMITTRVAAVHREELDRHKEREEAEFQRRARIMLVFLLLLVIFIMWLLAPWWLR